MSELEAKSSDPSKSSPYAVLLEPKDKLLIKGPYTSTSLAQLLVQNPSDKRLAFKVKSQEPQRYVVKPSKSFLEPKQSQSVIIRMKPIGDINTFNPAKQKFMVQSVVASAECGTVLSAFNEHTSGIFTTKFIAVFDGIISNDSASTESVRPKSMQSVVSRTSINSLNKQPQNNGSDDPKSAALSPTDTSKPAAPVSESVSRAEVDSTVLLVGIGLLLLACLIICQARQ